MIVDLDALAARLVATYGPTRAGIIRAHLGELDAQARWRAHTITGPPESGIVAASFLAADALAAAVCIEADNGGDEEGLPAVLRHVADLAAVVAHNRLAAALRAT